MNFKIFPVLYKKSKNGKVSQWSISVEDTNDHPVIIRESGFIGFKFRVNRKFIKKGTNIGKSNEKTKYENACFIAANYWKKHIEDNYVENLDDIDNQPKFLKPMLAKPYKKISKFPVYVQPKYNGIRGVNFRHVGDNRIISRERKEFTAVQHIKDAVNIFDRYSPDGEIYHHDLTFQEIVRRTKKYREGLTEELEYWVYDLAIPNMLFSDRMELIREIVPVDHPIIKISPTYIAYSNEDLHKFHNEFVLLGFEGLIIRFPNEEYCFNDRPSCLQKYKEFIDDEFLIIDYEGEEWDDNGVIRTLIMWVCITDQGHKFNVRPKGSFLDRIDKYNNAIDYIGKNLTVRYQETSENGTPIFGVGLTFRDYE